MTERADSAPDPIDLSVVIPAHNAEVTIGEQLNALMKQEWSGEWEVIVADNGSNDDTRLIVNKFVKAHPRVRLANADGERGPSFARNAGVSEARGRAVAFCDADDVVADDWVARMGEALGRLEFVTGPLEQGRLNVPALQNIYGSALASGGQTFAGVFPFGASANLGVRRDLFTRLGGFDTTIRVGEDLDLCLRSWRDGTPVVFIPEAVVHYRNRSTLRSLGSQAISYGRASVMIRQRLATLNCPTPSRWRGAKNWLWLLKLLPTLRTPSGRARWVVVGGTSLGRAIESVRRGSVYL